MRSTALTGIIVAGLAALAVPAAAEDVASYEVSGDADAGGSDARTAALDEAFARAAQNALRDLVSGDVRAARKTELDREIIGHARLWVKSYQVGHDSTVDGRRQLEITARLDRDKLRDRLHELNVQLIGESTGGVKPRSVAVLVRVTRPDGVSADYGAGAEKDTAGVSALTGAMKSAGLSVRKSPTSGAAARGNGTLPLDDDEALQLANDAKAEMALVVGVTVGQRVWVHGVAEPSSLVTANVRMVVRGGRPDGADQQPGADGMAVAAATGDDPAALAKAIDRAVIAASADVVPPAPPAISSPGQFKGDDTPAQTPGVVLVRLKSGTPYNLVLSEAKYLGGARGVTSANVRRMGPNGWVIGVTTDESVDSVAQAARKSPSGASSASVKVTDGIVEVSLR